MKHPLLFLSFLFFFLVNIFADNPPFNPLVVDAGDDVTLCEPGQVQLEGSVIGDYCAFGWSPPFGLSDPNILDPTANVIVGSTTYYLSGYSFDPSAQNLVDNGGFENGNTGFTSAYGYQPVGDLNEENYDIVTTGNQARPEWSPCSDVSGGGNMMAVNASTNGGVPVWCQTVNVQPNTPYIFSVWLVTLFPVSPAELQFTVDGLAIGDNFTANPDPCNWEQNCNFWFSGGSSSAEFCIININTESFGNDFAIDEVSVTQACETTDSLTLAVENVFAITDPFALIPCNNTGVTLDGTGSSTGPGVTYSWMTSTGNIVSGGNTLNPTVDAPGIYELTVSIAGSFGPCTATATVEVLNDIPPEANAITSNDINCLSTTGTIVASGSTVGPNISYQWTTTDGFIISGATDFTAIVGAEGTYTLIVTDITNNCTAEASTFVSADLNLPTAVADPDTSLNCNITTVIIDGSGSSGGPNLSFSWTTTNGNIISGTTADSIIVDSAGVYELIVTNDDNGCTAVALANVSSDFTQPVIDIADPDTLDCSVTNFSLDASGSTGINSLLFVWTTATGNIVSGDSTAMPEIDQLGTYLLVLTDDGNGCTSIDSVLVEGDLTPPILDIAPPEELNCNINELNLDASGSQTGVSFSWTTNTGNIVSGENTAQPNVDQSGIYYLTITDPNNGCTAADSVDVEADQSLPIAEAGAVVQLDCTTISANLDGTSSSTGTEFSYLWTTTNGDILNGETTLEPEIGSGGTYVLIVTNDSTGCTSQDNVIIPQNNDLPTADASVDEELNCLNATVTIDATNSSSGSDYSFVWNTPNGNIINGSNTLEPEVDQAGTYILTVTNLNSNCTATATVILTENFTTPQADPGSPATLTCTNDTLQLNGSNSILGNNDSVLWTTPDGSFAEGENILTPTITASGTYTLTITNNESGCTNEASVLIDENMATPVADAGNPVELTCAITSISLNGNGSSQSGNFSYLWTTQNGNIVSGENGLMPVVDAEGDYLLTVTDNDNGCENTSEVEVSLNGLFPDADAGATAELTCAITETTLNGSGDVGNEFTYLWTTTDGVIVSNENTLNPMVGASGTYTLTVTNQDNGCISTDDVFISENTIPPSVDAGPTDELSCTQTQLSLNGTGNAPSNNISFSWATPNGNILSGSDSPTPLVNAAGTYWLTITDNENGCVDSASVTITQDANVPIADAGATATLTCDVTSIQLDGSGSSANANITYLWTTPDGNIVSGEMTLSPEIDSPGTYLLTVTDVANNCDAVSSVLINENTTPPAANAGPDGLLTCDVTALVLDGTASANGPDFTYQWTTANGNIVSDATTNMPSVDASGIYEVVVTNIATGCTNTASVEVTEDTTPPTVFIETPPILTCELVETTLDASNSSTGNQFSYLWTTTTGNIVSDDTSPTPLINANGDYNLLITNDLTGCTATASVSVSINTVLPFADAGPSIELDCITTVSALNGTGSSTGSNFQYSWVTGNGNIVSGETTLTPQVNAAGNYTLTVLDETNGCLSTAEVEVTEDVELPIINILPPAILTCKAPETTIDAGGSSMGIIYQYDWTTQNGNIVNGQNTPLLTVDEPGDYVLTISNSDNGCEASTSVIVGEDVDLPAVDAGPSYELHCNLTEVNLMGNTDVSVGQFTAAWDTGNGNIVSGDQSLTPLVNAPGTYQLTIVNTATGCSNTNEVVVTENVLSDFDFEIQDPTCLDPSGVVEFTDVVGGAAPFSYSLDNGQSFSTQPIFPNLSNGLYDLVVQDANGCTLTDVALLAEPPEIEVFLEAQVVLDLGESYQMNAQTSLPDNEIGSVEWMPSDDLSCDDCLAPLATPLQQTHYEVKVTSIDGCTAIATTALFVRKNVDIYVPNAFSPNGDGTNDLLIVYAGGNGVSKISSFKIFSRWGESVFEYFDFPPNDPQYGWNGKHKGETMNPAVFVWTAEVELVDGSKRLLKGDVTLTR